MTTPTTPLTPVARPTPTYADVASLPTPTVASGPTEVTYGHLASMGTGALTVPSYPQWHPPRPFFFTAVYAAIYLASAAVASRMNEEAMLSMRETVPADLTATIPGRTRFLSRVLQLPSIHLIVQPDVVLCLTSALRHCFAPLPTLQPSTWKTNC